MVLRAGDPVASEPDAPAPRPPAPPHAILVVDDEAAIRESLELTLRDDYRVFTAATGEEGLSILERERIALIITDQELPTMKGVEFLESAIGIAPRAIRMMLT